MKIYPAGTYLKISLSTGFAGMDTYFYVKLDSEYTEDILNDVCWEEAVQHAESYGVYPISEYSDEEMNEDEEDCYTDNIEGYFEVVTEEEAEEEGFTVWG